VKKGVIFWLVWAVVIAAAGAVYLVLVHPKLSENATKRQHRDLFYARLTELKDDIGEVKSPSDTIRRYSEKLAMGVDRKKFTENELKYEKLFPESLLPRDTDKKLYMIYPLNNNSSRIPNEADVKARKQEEEGLTAERQKFVESFKEMQFAVDQTLAPGDNKDFQPAPPKDNFLFMQWVIGSAERSGQDQLIDQLLEAKLGKGCMSLQKSDIEAPGSACTWKSDGRCSGYIEDKPETRQLVLKRLVLRRLALMAAARAGAPVETLLPDKYDGKRLESNTTVVQRKVQYIDALEFLDGDLRATDPARAFVPARNNRFAAAGLSAPTGKDNPVPYKPNGFLLRLRCHPAVIPSVIAELEKIGSAEVDGERKRPFTCWVERVLIERPGKLDWRPDAVMLKSDKLPRDGGNRYHEWPVAAEILAVVPEFDLEDKLDPKP
jgi:hypothetical protein